MQTIRGLAAKQEAADAASLAAAWATPLGMLLVRAGSGVVIVGTLMALVITVRHQDNIRRLRTGAESRFDDPAP